MLTDAKLKSLKGREKPYKVSDRDGLYVMVAPTSRISFRYSYHVNGRYETLTPHLPPHPHRAHADRPRQILAHLAGDGHVARPRPNAGRLRHQYLGRAASRPCWVDRMVRRALPAVS